MSRLRLRHADAPDEAERAQERDVLPFPVGWRDEPSEAEALAAEVLTAAATTEELEQTIHRMQREIDELRDELDDALHLPRDAGWRPPAA
ncbi:MAG: hypothetical protein ACF8QF_14275 [Phycisphaerales bacterium]